MTLNKKKELMDIKPKMELYSACHREKTTNLSLLLVDKDRQSSFGIVIKQAQLQR